MTRMHPIFVFGTLKEGFPNFHINKGIRIKGRFHTNTPYPLYLVGERYAPWLIQKENEGHQVGGEVFLVDKDGMNRMDLLERIHEPDGYRKTQIIVVSELTQEEMRVDAYLKPPEQLNKGIIRLGPLREYTLSHAMLYRPRNP